MFRNDFRVHRARVFLFLMLLLMIVVVARAIEVNRPYLWGSAIASVIALIRIENRFCMLVVRLL